MNGRLLELRSRGDMPRWPRHREGAREDERRWVDQLSDSELADLVAGLTQVDRAVKAYREGEVAHGVSNFETSTDDEKPRIEHAGS